MDSYRVIHRIVIVKNKDVELDPGEPEKMKVEIRKYKNLGYKIVTSRVNKIRKPVDINGTSFYLIGINSAFFELGIVIERLRREDYLTVEGGYTISQGTLELNAFKDDEALSGHDVNEEILDEPMRGEEHE